MIKLLNKLGIEDVPSFWKLVKQFIKFGVVGVSNTLIHLAIYYGFLFLGLHHIFANIIAFMISVLNAYYWNNKYVFIQKGKSNSLLKITKVYVSYGFTLVLSTGLLFLMVDMMGISRYIAPIISLIITVPTNFVLNKYWVFKN